MVGRRRRPGALWLLALAPLYAAGASGQDVLTEIDACRVEVADTYRARIECGTLRVPDAGLGARQTDAETAPRVSVGDLVDEFERTSAPWVIDLRVLSHRADAPWGPCGRRSGATRTTANEALLRLLRADVLRVFQGDPPLCFDIPEKPGELLEVPEEQSPEKIDAALEGAMAEFVRPDTEGLAVVAPPVADTTPEPEIEEHGAGMFDRSTPISDRAFAYANKVRDAHNGYRVCPEDEVLDIHRLRDLTLRVKARSEIAVDLKPLVEQAGGTLVPVACTYSDYRGRWDPVNFACEDERHCFDLWEDGGPRDCDRFAVSDKFPHVLEPVPGASGCFGKGKGETALLAPLGRGVYALMHELKSGERSHTIVLAPGTYIVQDDLDQGSPSP